MTTTNGDTPIDNPRFILSGGISGDILLPDNLSAIPDDVRLANDEAVSAFEKYQLAEREYRDARALAQQAPALDQASDASAVALGKPLPEQRATFKSRQALQDAARANSKQPRQTPGTHSSHWRRPSPGGSQHGSRSRPGWSMPPPTNAVTS